MQDKSTVNISAEWEKEVGKGWQPIVKEAVEQILAKGGIIRQVKEKFGGLRLYVDGWKDVQDIARAAERRCENICENCGKPGELRRGSWVKCLCDDCPSVNYGA